MSDMENNNVTPESLENNSTNYYQNPAIIGQEKQDGMAIASLVLGILSILCCYCTFFFGIVPSVIGFILGLISNNKKSSGIAIAGIVTSIIGFVIAIAALFFVVIVGLQGNGGFADFFEELFDGLRY